VCGACNCAKVLELHDLMMIKTHLLKGIFAFAIVANVNPAHALVSSFTWNGSGTYNCVYGSGACTLTASNFTLNFDSTTTTWSNNSGSNGSLTIISPGNPSANFNFNNIFTSPNFNGTYIVPISSGGVSSTTSFTLSDGFLNDDGVNYAKYITFILDTPVIAGLGNQVTSITALSSPFLYAANDTQPDNPVPAPLSTPIFGLSAPGPLGLLALYPLFNIARKRKSLKATF
jgi:hypothetical protein